MVLRSVRIQDYKCISDSEEFNVGPITCLVGKNESGKTAILQALYKLNPDISSKNKFVDLEYPRNKWKPSMNANDLRWDALVTTWELDDEEVKLVEEEFVPGILKSKIITIKRGYDNIDRWSVEFDEEVLAKHLLSSGHLAAPESNKIRALKTVAEIVKTLEGLGEPTENQTNFLKQLKEKFKRGTAELAIIDFLSPRTPRFVYFSDYYTLPGQVALEDFNQKKAEDKLTFAERVFIALLALAGTTPEAINDIATFERLRASLEAVSNGLSNEIFEYWSQNAYLEVTFGFDHARAEDPPPFNSGYIFRTSIRNLRHKSTVSFDERSRGFVWFFSFLVWFSQVKEVYGEKLIILLDEPALNLHARAQGDLLRYIKERLSPYQVIYTTHSPFMIDPDNLAGAKTVEDVVVKEVAPGGGQREKLLGTKVSDDVLAVDPDTISPLQGAIGYDITQTLFVGKYNLLIEGPSDLLYFRWFSERLRANARTQLDRRWVLCPVGGIDKVSSFAALFGANKLHLAVFTDYHKGEKNKIRSLRESKLLKAGHVFSAEMYTGKDESDIEDVIGRENYTTLVNMCYNLKGADVMSLAAPADATVRVLEEVKTHFATIKGDVPEFDHYTPAQYLVENSAEITKAFPDLEGALKRFEQFFGDVNKCIPE